jgi:large subunit ribosomal protein L7/L12
MSQRTWHPDVVALGDRIAGLTLAGAAELRNYLETVYGISPGTRAGLVPEVTPEVIIDNPRVEPTEFDVFLDEFDAARKVAAIRAVREATGVGLKAARDLVEGAPKVVKERLPRAEAEAVKAVLEAAGAKVSVRACAA